MFFKILRFFCFLFIGVVESAEKTTAPTILYSRQSPFGLIEVVTTNTRGLLGVCENEKYYPYQSMFMQGDATYLGLWYQPLATTSFCFVENFEKVLLLGIGAGDFLSYLLNYFPKTQVDVVEINHVMIDITKKFRAPKNTVNFINGDAFKHIARMKKSYDLIYCDIYFMKPFIAKEYKDFFVRVNNHLNQGGVFVWNAHIPFIPRGVVEDMFRNFENIVASITNDGENIVFLCYQGPQKTKQDLEIVAENVQKQHNFRYALPDVLQKFEFIPLADYETWITKFPVLS